VHKNIKKTDSVLPEISAEALDILPFGAYIVDERGDIVFANKKMAAISGSEVKDMIGQNLYNIPSYKKYGFIKYIDRGLSGTHFRVKGKKYISHVGQKESVRSYYGIPVKNKNGKVEKLLCIAEDISSQIKAEEKVKRSLAERNILLKEVHHRVKNNMQVIYSLLNLQLSRVADKEAKRLIKESQQQIKSMMLIHSSSFLGVAVETYSYLRTTDVIPGSRSWEE